MRLGRDEDLAAGANDARTRGQLVAVLGDVVGGPVDADVDVVVARVGERGARLLVPVLERPAAAQMEEGCQNHPEDEEDVHDVVLWATSML